MHSAATDSNLRVRSPLLFPPSTDTLQSVMENNYQPDAIQLSQLANDRMPAAYAARLATAGLAPVVLTLSLFAGPVAETNAHVAQYAHLAEPTNRAGSLEFVVQEAKPIAGVPYWSVLPTLASYVEIDSLSDADELDEIFRLATKRLGW